MPPHQYLNSTPDPLPIAVCPHPEMDGVYIRHQYCTEFYGTNPRCSFPVCVLHLLGWDEANWCT